MAKGDLPPLVRGGKPELYQSAARARLLAVQALRRRDEAEATFRAARRAAEQARLRYEAILAEYEGQEALEFEEGHGG